LACEQYVTRFDGLHDIVKMWQQAADVKDVSCDTIWDRTGHLPISQ
jgi:hypothetical protein